MSDLGDVRADLWDIVVDLQDLREDAADLQDLEEDTAGLQDSVGELLDLGHVGGC